MAPRYSRPRLISAEDTQYRLFLAQIMCTKENQRAIRPPRARDLFGGEAETALRQWLAQRYPLDQRRIIEYLEHRGRMAIKKYRELDAVSLPDPKTIHVFEIKASQKALSLRRAMQQLHETRTLLSMLFVRVYTTVLLVNTGIPTPDEVAALMAGPEAPPTPPPTLDQMLAALPQLRRVATLEEQHRDPQIVDLLCFSVDDIIALAGAENLHLDWEVDDADDEPVVPAPEARYVYTTAADTQEQEEDSALGAALRQAMKGPGDDPHA